MATLLLMTTAFAGVRDLSGEVGIEARGFFHDPRFDAQLETSQVSLLAKAKVRWEDDDRAHQASFGPFLRLDSEDDERTHFDIREAYWRHIRDAWELLIGIETVFWGVAESRHLVNVINQVDQVESIDEEEFLGQPMIQVGTLGDVGRFDLFILTGFRERTFPGKEGRLRPAIPVDTDASRFESDRKEQHVDAALRYAHSIGDWDIGVHYFHGTGREPRLLRDETGTRLIPRYDIVDQLGADIQYTRDEWLWKFEGILRDGQGDGFGAAVAGFEYTLHQVLDSNMDLGILAEYLRDGRDPDVAPTTPFENGLFTGARLAFNDVQDTSALIGSFVNINDHSTSFRIEAERRIGESYTLELVNQWFFNVDRSNPLASVADDDFLMLRFTRHF